ncbi:PWWP domain containing protein, partial [Rhypophila decipiens]
AIAEKTAETVADQPDVEMTDDAPAPAAGAAPTEAAAATATDAPASATTPANKKRKSVGGSEAKGKKLNKKQSKARILHLDAKPGDHYFVKLKGFPQWPVIICDEDMLPQSLIKSRPVTAKRADGSYREDFADGGKKAHERTFPVMYLHTNEFGWVPNSDLIELDPATVLDVKLDKMRKDLQAAHKLASEHHDLDYYKEVLQAYQEELLEQAEAKAAKAAAKAATPSKKKTQATTDEEGDVDMADADADDTETPAKEKKTKKRKAEENIETPARSDSVKKRLIKLTTSSTPKTTNGTSSTPKAATDSKAAKSKTKKGKEPKVAEEKKIEKATTPEEPKLTPEDIHGRKQKEVLFLRHKLQKGLLTRDQEPKEEEMKGMSDFVSKLEAFPDLEVSIIRATKINKVLKAILKLENIPKEQEFNFKSRSQVLLDKWNKLLASDSTPAPAAAEANGVNGSAKEKVAPRHKTNGVKDEEKSAEPEKVVAKKEEEPSKEAKKEEEEEVKAPSDEVR